VHRLMIVDDERHIVDWLFELFLNLKLELDIVKAYSAQEALQRLEASKIDIVLSDIRMPGMSGLELMERIKDNWPSCRIVFLTGYNEFEYIYAAKKQTGVSYLLKTEDDDVIIEAVNNAMIEIERELGNRQWQSRALEREELVAHLMRKELLLDVADGKVRLADANRAWLDKLSIPFDESRPVLLLLGRSHDAIDFPDYSEKFLVLRGLSALSDRNFSSIVSHALLDISNYDLLWILQPTTSEDDASVSDNEEQRWQRTTFYIKEMLETLQAASEEVMEMRISFLLYEQPVLWSSVREKWDLMKSIADVRLISPRGMSAVFTIDAEEALTFDAANKTILEGGLIDRKIEALQECLEQGLRNEFFERLEELNEALHCTTRMRDLSVAQVYCAISLLFLTYINRNALAEKLADRVSLARLIPSSGFESWNDSFNYLRELGHAMFALKEDERSHREDELIEKIKAFVRSNLQGELTLVRISKMVNYNSSYVSRFFKKSTGTNLFDFIHKARISKAKELLEDRSLTIQEIAKATGFDSPQYFATAFKKTTGSTPNEYRSQLS